MKSANIDEKTGTGISRKDFLSHCALLGIGTLALPVLSLESCSSVPNYEPEWTSVGARIPTSAFAQRTTLIVAKRFPLTAPLCVHKVNDQSYTAVLMKCTHKGCEVLSDGPQLVCPCHGSEFTLDGHVLSAPATENLKSYVVTVDSDSILVHLFA